MINEELTSSDSTVDELQKVSLRCATSGYPDPSVSWRRENGKSLNLGLYGGKKFAGKLMLLFIKRHTKHLYQIFPKQINGMANT